MSLPFVCVTVAALLAAPSPSPGAAADAVLDVHVASAPAASDGSVMLADAATLVGASAPSSKPAPKPGGELVVSDVVMVVNTDGSATLSATFTGGSDAMALEAVSISTTAGHLDVASTRMWLPILPGRVSRAGDASDAGGFVVSTGLAPGQVAHVQLQFDNGTCAELDAPTVRRTRAHDEVYPTNGQALGPGKPTPRKPGCEPS